MQTVAGESRCRTVIEPTITSENNEVEKADFLLRREHTRITDAKKYDACSVTLSKEGSGRVSSIIELFYLTKRTQPDFCRLCVLM